MNKVLKMAVLFCTAMLLAGSGVSAAEVNPDDWARPEVVATPQWVAEHYDDSNVVVLDGSDYKDGTYVEKTIEGAVYVPYRDLRWNKGLYLGMYWGMEKELWNEQPFETLFRKAGVNDDSTVVVVGQARIDDAADVWWALKLLGKEDVKLLPVNYLEQPELEGIITSNVPRAKELSPSGNFEAEINWDMYATRDDIKTAMADPSIGIQDNRHANEYSGDLVLGVRGGYVPTAKLWDFRDYHTDKSSAELKSASYLQNGLEERFPNADTIYSYCQSAHRSGLGVWISYAAGYGAANFDGSWRYYAADGSLPVANAAYPVTGLAVQNAGGAAQKALSTAESAQTTAQEAKDAASGVEGKIDQVKSDLSSQINTVEQNAASSQLVLGAYILAIIGIIVGIAARQK